MSLRIGNVCDMSAPQGGISRAVTLDLIALAHGRAFSYDNNDIGATSPGRWQLAHLLYMIGATSFANVGAPAAAGVCDCAVTLNDATAATAATSNAKRFMVA